MISQVHADRLAEGFARMARTLDALADDFAQMKAASDDFAANIARMRHDSDARAERWRLEDERLSLTCSLLPGDILGEPARRRLVEIDRRLAELSQPTEGAKT